MKRPARLMLTLALVLSALSGARGDVTRPVPLSVEAFLLGMEGINDAAVVGVPDARLQEVVVAFVVPRLGAALDAERLIQNAHGRIASFKIPRHVFFEDALPMTPSGKVRKVELRALARRRLGLPETDGASKR